MQNAYKLHPLTILLLNLLYKLPLTFIKYEKTICKKFQFSSYFLSFFFSFSNKLNLKTIVCMWILQIPNDCSATGHLSFLVWGTIRATTGKLRPQNGLKRCLACSVVNFWGFCSIILSMAHIVRPHPDACNCEKAEVRWRCCASRYLFDLLNVIALFS